MYSIQGVIHNPPKWQIFLLERIFSHNFKNTHKNKYLRRKICVAISLHQKPLKMVFSLCFPRKQVSHVMKIFSSILSKFPCASATSYREFFDAGSSLAVRLLVQVHVAPCKLIRPGKGLEIQLVLSPILLSSRVSLFGPNLNHIFCLQWTTNTVKLQFNEVGEECQNSLNPHEFRTTCKTDRSRQYLFLKSLLNCKSSPLNNTNNTFKA